MVQFLKNITIGALLGTAVVFALGGPEDNWLETWQTILSNETVIKELRT